MIVYILCTKNILIFIIIPYDNRVYYNIFYYMHTHIFIYPMIFMLDAIQLQFPFPMGSRPAAMQWKATGPAHLHLDLSVRVDGSGSRMMMNDV